MIDSIELKNWRSHLDTKMDFSDGTNVLVGIVGAGKTSVLDGLCFGLFGTFPTLASKKIKLEDMIMKKPQKKDKAEIVVNFSIGEDNYSVKRIIQKGKTNGELRKNGKLIEAPQTQRVTEEVEKILKIHYDLFTRAVYSEQNEIDMFLTIPKGKRMSKIDQLLSIDKFETVRKNTVVLVNKCFAYSNEKKKIIEGLEAGQSGGVSSVKDEIIKLGNERERLLVKLGSVKDKKSLQERKLADLKRIDKRLREIDTEEKTCIAIIQAYKADIDKLSDVIEIAEKSDEQFLQEISEREASLSGIKTDLVKDKEKLLDIRKTITSKDTEAKILSEEKIPRLKKNIDDKKKLYTKLKRSSPEKLNQKLQERVIELDKEKEKLHRFSARIEETEETIKQMEEIEKRCPLCDQGLTESKKIQIIKLKKMRIARSIKLKDDSLKNIEKFEKNISKLSMSLKESERMETQLLGMGNLEEDFKSSETILKSIKSEIKNLSTEEKMLDKTVSLLEKDYESKLEGFNELKRFYEKKKELVEKTDKINESQSKISSLRKDKENFSGFYPEIIPSIENELMEVYGMLKGLEVKVQNTDSIIIEKKKILDELEKKKKIVDSYKSEVTRLDNIAEQLSLFESSVKSTQDQLRKNFITAVNQAMDEIWNQIYPYNDFYSARLGIEGDYTLQLLDDTGWINVDGVASGGERSIACLVLRIAFSLVLAPQLRWLVMDEPTHNLDSKTVEDFSLLLREQIPRMIDQVFIITHDQALESAVSGHLYKLHRDKASNEPTKAIHMNKDWSGN
jgi:DNA repair protein SbcC/Rad50